MYFNKTPEQKEAEGIAAAFVMAAALIGGGLHVAYEYLSPGSAANAATTEQEVVIEQCVQNGAGAVDHSFFTRLGHVWSSLPGSHVLAKVGDGQIALSWISGEEELDGKEPDYSYSVHITRDYAQTVYVDRQNEKAIHGIRAGYYDRYRTGKTSHTDWHETGYVDARFMDTANRGVIQKLQACMRSYPAVSPR